MRTFEDIRQTCSIKHCMITDFDVHKHTHTHTCVSDVDLCKKIMYLEIKTRDPDYKPVLSATSLAIFKARLFKVSKSISLLTNRSFALCA